MRQQLQDKQVIYVEEPTEPQRIVVVRQPSRQKRNRLASQRASLFLLPFWLGVFMMIGLIFALDDADWLIKRFVVALGVLFFAGGLCAFAASVWFEIKGAFEAMWYGEDYYYD